MDDLSRVTTKETAWQLGYISGLKNAVKHGKWVRTEGNLYYCSACLGYPSYIPTKCQTSKFCPNCGAKMDMIEMSKQDLELINAISKREFKPEDVYTFELSLCNNEVDRDFERFPRETLETLAPLFVGKNGILNHKLSAANLTARIYKTEVVDDWGKSTKAGDLACYLKAWAFIPYTNETASFIAEIENGIKKEVSIGCAIGKMICSVCGKELKECSHIKGHTYDEKLCWGELIDVKDAYEWAFVIDPRRF